jgi:hypothetical protein
LKDLANQEKLWGLLIPCLLQTKFSQLMSPSAIMIAGQVLTKEAHYSQLDRGREVYGRALQPVTTLFRAEARLKTGFSRLGQCSFISC